MSAKILDGASVAQAIKDEVAGEVAEYSRRGVRPGLAAVLVGSDSASQIYVSGKVRTCEQLGLYSEKIDLPETTMTEELLALVRDLNSRDEIDGILIQFRCLSKSTPRSCSIRLTRRRTSMAFIR